MPAAWINDDKMLGKVNEDMVFPAWKDDPLENMAEDFLHLYFPNPHPWLTNYPDIYDNDEYIAIRNKLQEYFSYTPYETLNTEAIPKFMKSEQFVMKGQGNPNTDVYIVSGDSGYHLKTDTKGIFEMKWAANKKPGLNVYKLTFSPTLEFDKAKEYFD